MNPLVFLGGIILDTTAIKTAEATWLLLEALLLSTEKATVRLPTGLTPSGLLAMSQAGNTQLIKKV